MTRSPKLTIGLAVLLAAILVAGIGVVSQPLWKSALRTQLIAYFDSSTGIYPGDNVLILGVKVGKVETIEPQPQSARITFSVDSKYSVPADVHAAIISPQLVTSRAIQLTPAYTGGPKLGDKAVIPRERTAVPVEFDDLRVQLEKLSQSLEPSGPGEPSPLGAFVNTAADNLRGQGDQMRTAVIELSRAISAFGDHSDDAFTTVKDLSVLVSGLQSSTVLMRELNTNFAAVTQVLSNDPGEVGQAIVNIDAVSADIQNFAAEHKDAFGLTADKFSSVSTALVESLDDIKQTLHLAPNVLGNYNSMYYPALGGAVGALAVNNFANPIDFICGGVQAASRLGAEQAAKLCVQYLAPILKNRQYNFPPIGTTIGPTFPIPVAGAKARPNEVTYSEDWMRPDYRPEATLPAEQPGPPPGVATSTDPAAGLPGLMVGSGGGR
ncbi:MCE family protein [Mycolicibacterium holsaticum]|uniref:Mammalian cell entry protein n=1 Tax=Mycolicibacterium holsaticum TaxID=152142 RepID=A0A1E3S4P7_9MYCO|nr:MCE family protein [Mycolicibacterium holsaticum]ODQ96642.1 mammalian cell entry protein [Mycolicibacterium holsaticum]